MAIGKVIGRVAIKVLPDTTEFREKTANDLRRVEKQLGNVQVDVIPNLDKSTKDRVGAELKAWAKDLNLIVKVDLDLNDRDIADSVVALEALTKKRSVKIAPELDNGAVAKVATALAAMSGLRYTQQLFHEFRQELLNIDKAVPKIGLVSHAIAGLGAWALGVSGNLFSLSSSIAQMGQAGLALPGILGGIAVGLATSAAALKDFNVQVPQAALYLHKLQNIISQNFWEVAAAPIRELVDKLFPILNKKLAETSTALGGFFGKLATSATNILLPALAPMFDNLTKSIEIASGYTDVFVGIIEKLGTLGSSYLPSLAKWFGDISTRFNNFLGKAQADGSLKKWTDDGITALKNFGSVIASTVSIFHSLGKAAQAAGGSTLASLAENLRGVAAAAKDPGFQNGLTATLTAAYAMLKQIRDIAGPALKGLVIAMSQNFQKLGPIIGDTIGTAISALATAFSNPAVAKGLDAMFAGFNDMVHTLAPAMVLVAEKFGIMGELVGALARNIGLVMASGIMTLKPVFISLVAALIPVINMLGPILSQVITALGPVFALLGVQLAKAATALGPLFDQLKILVDLLLPVLVPVLKILVEVIGSALIGVIQGVTLVIKGLVNIVTGVVSVFKGFKDILVGLFTLDFSQIGKGIKEVFGGLGSIILGLVQAGLGAVWAYLNGTVVGFFKKFAIKLIAPFAGPLTKLFKPLETAAAKVMPILEKMFGAIKDGLSYIFGGAGGTFISRIKEVLVYPFKSAGAAIEGAFTGIKQVITVAWNVIKIIFETALTVIRTIIEVHLTIIRTLFETAFTVIRTLIETAFKVIATVFETAFTTIRAIITLAWDAIVTSVTVYLDIIKAVIETAWGAIRAVIGAAMDAISAVIKVAWDAISSVISAVVGTIKTVITTTWNAIKSTSSSVFTAIKDLISKIWNSIKDFISGSLSSIRGVVSGGMNSIKGTMSAAWNSVKSTVSSAWSSVKSAVTTGVSNAAKEAGKLPGKALDGLAGIGTSLYHAGTQLIQGFINGIGDMFSKVKGKLGDLTGKLTSWKGPPAKDKTLLTNAGHLIIDSLIAGFDDKFADVRSMLTDLTTEIAGFIGTSMSKQISDALSFAMTGDVGTTITASAAVQGVNLDRRLGGLEANVTSAARSASKDASKSEAPASISIGNITIPLEDLAQLKDLEEFLDMLRVRTRQG